MQRVSNRGTGAYQARALINSSRRPITDRWAAAQCLITPADASGTARSWRGRDNGSGAHPAISRQHKSRGGPGGLARVK